MHEPVDLEAGACWLSRGGSVYATKRINCEQSLYISDPRQLVYRRDGRLVHTFREPGVVLDDDLVVDALSIPDLPVLLLRQAAYFVFVQRAEPEVIELRLRGSLTLNRQTAIIERFLDAWPQFRPFARDIARLHAHLVSAR